MGGDITNAKIGNCIDSNARKGFELIELKRAFFIVLRTIYLLRMLFKQIAGPYPDWPGFLRRYFPTFARLYTALGASKSTEADTSIRSTDSSTSVHMDHSRPLPRKADFKAGESSSKKKEKTPVEESHFPISKRIAYQIRSSGITRSH